MVVLNKNPQFCEKCGAGVGSARFCPSCGHKIGSKPWALGSFSFGDLGSTVENFLDAATHAVIDWINLGVGKLLAPGSADSKLFYWNIAAIFLCNPFVGGVALYYSFRVRSARNKGEFYKASESARYERVWLAISVVAAVLFRSAPLFWLLRR